MKTDGQRNMNNGLPEAKGYRLNWLLDDLVNRLAGAERAVVLSADGLLLGRSQQLQREDAEHLSAMSSAFRSLARSVGDQFGKGLVHQTVVELEYGFLVVTEAGEGACLALLASVTADLGMVAYEMNVLVQQVGTELSAAPRQQPADLRAT
jgi:predicted regulator of Ras-like GTPase activity (Roadblock/LC7/MglB family)